ncbi:MAG: hypothetical protein VX589_13145 [Myxococcota bacterium]|nr:hypothetical protein [Myxococcota bacterium]
MWQFVDQRAIVVNCGGAQFSRIDAFRMVDDRETASDADDEPELKGYEGL